MLELRPTCENCNKPLPPDSPEARICSYECTFCAACVEIVLRQRLPQLRRRLRTAARAATDLEGRQLSRQGPGRHTVKHRPRGPEAHARFAAAIRGIPPGRR